MDEKELKERLERIEFRQELLFNNSNADRILFEYNIRRDEYEIIMDIMDNYSDIIENKSYEINCHRFEKDIYTQIPHLEGNYHFCEYITRAFMEDGRWGDVFPALYGKLPKYKEFMNEYDNE